MVGKVVLAYVDIRWMSMKREGEIRSRRIASVYAEGLETPVKGFSNRETYHAVPSYKVGGLLEGCGWSVVTEMVKWVEGAG